ELLDCLRRAGAINEEFMRRLKALGIDLASFLKCLERKCRGTAAAIETRVRPSSVTRTNLNLAAFSRDELARLITEAMNQSLNSSSNESRGPNSDGSDA
ncbi:hypothetical protein, partial [Geobacter sp.]|uniref:hypothetical protein n=1 Tax=Geobacter sp. TaxID=46610 RepID=UPI0027B98230